MCIRDRVLELSRGCSSGFPVWLSGVFDAKERRLWEELRRGGAVLEGRIVQMFGMKVSSEEEQHKWNFFVGLEEVGSEPYSEPVTLFFHSEPSVGINRIPEPGGKTIPRMEPGAEPLSSRLWQTWKSLLSFEPSSAILLPLWAEDFFCISNCQD